MSGTGHADSTSPETTVTVQDQGANDGAQVQTQAIQGTLHSSGIQGTSKPATDGTITGPLMDAVPQCTAG